MKANLTNRRLREHMKLAEGINSILQAALTSADEYELGLTCLRIAEDITGSAFGFISEVREDRLLYDIVVSNPGWDVCQALSLPGHGQLRASLPIEGLYGRVISTGKSCYSNAPREDPDRVGLPVGHPPLNAFLGTPLIQAGETFGLIGLANRPEGYDDDTVELLEILAPAIVQAFQRIRSDAADRRQATLAQAFRAISEAVHSTLEDREILQRVALEIVRATGFNAAAVHLRQQGQWRFAITQGLPEELARLQLTDEQSPMSAGVIKSLEPLVITDWADERANTAFMRRYDIRKLIAVPLVVRGNALGVLFAGVVGDAQGDFTSEQVDFLAQVGTTLALALENAKLYEGQYRIAQTLQESLLALPERVPGVAFSHAYRSATEAALVGGDFYDIFEMEHDRVGLIIGDVAGKGLEAAVLTSLLKNTIRAHASERLSEPGRVMRMTSDLVYKLTPPEAFATAFLAFLRCRDGQLLYCNAGHTTSVIVRADGAIARLPGNSPVIGAFEDGVFRESEAVLDADELLVMYTDGVIEARGEGRLYGEDRLFRTVAASKDGDPGKVVRAVIADVLQFCSGQLSDDLAIMAVKLVAGQGETPLPEEVAVAASSTV